jgi:hypothetical protein
MSAATATAPLPAEAPSAAQSELLNFVRRQVQALLLATPSYLILAPGARKELAGNIVRVAATAAGLAQEVWAQSEALGQTPVVRYKRTRAPLAAAQAAGDDFRPAATGQVAKITEQQLRAIAFPTFVADLIRGTFDAIVTSSIREMEAYGELISNVSRTVEEFESVQITPNQARQWLIERYPEHIALGKEGGQPIAVPAEGADERPPIDWKAELSLLDDISLDESSIEEVLVPAARRRLAETRLKTLSTLVMLGVNRIVVTGGKIRATMGFHIDASDRAHAEEATDFDIRHGSSGSFGYGPWSASASMSIAYVRSTRADSDAELNVETDLTGEVEIHFMSDYFPISRFAGAGQIGAIQANTAVPEANTPISHEKIEWGGSADVEKRDRVKREARKTTLRPGGGVGEPPKMAVEVPKLPSWAERKEAKDQDKRPEAPAKKDEPKKEEPKKEGTEQPKAEEKKPPEQPKAEEKPAEQPKSGTGAGSESTTAPPPQPGAENPPAAQKTTSGGGS